MKKLFLFTVTAVLLSFSTNNDQKKLHFEITPELFQKLWYCVDNANVPHPLVIEVQNVLRTQYAAQTDSATVKPPIKK